MKKETAQAILKLSEDEYDAYASEFSLSRQYFWRELEFFKEFVHEGDHVLDVGCGNGRLVDLFEDVSIKYTGVDFSEKLIAIARENRASRGSFLHANALALPFEDNSFDVVFSVAVLHHIPSKEYRTQFASEIHRVLKPGGTLVLTVWDILQWKFARAHAEHFLKKVCGLSPLDFGDVIISFGKEKRKRYVHAFTQKSLKKIFTQNDFVNISVREVKRKSGYVNFVVLGEKQ